jgi:hypothetical protein
LRIVTRGQATRYVLLHLTNSDDGRDLMKECTWSVAPAGEFVVRRSGNPDQQFLIKPEPGLRSVSVSDYPPEVAHCLSVRVASMHTRLDPVSDSAARDRSSTRLALGATISRVSDVWRAHKTTPTLGHIRDL